MLGLIIFSRWDYFDRHKFIYLGKTKERRATKKKAPVVETAVVPSEKILTQDVYESKDERFEVNHPQDNNKSNTKLKVNK